MRDACGAPVRVQGERALISSFPPERLFGLWVVVCGVCGVCDVWLCAPCARVCLSAATPFVTDLWSCVGSAARSYRRAATQGI